MKSGTVILQDSNCPDGWTVGSGSPMSSKCYKLFDNATTYNDASQACRNNGFGSIESRLVLINSYDEMNLVRGLCRGSGTNASANGCWIGLRDIYGNGTFVWEESIQAKKTRKIDPFDFSFSFFDWRRHSRTNITIYEGVNDESPRRCVIVYPWSEDPIIQEQGLMKDVSCSAVKSYVCQINAVTNKFTLTTKIATLENADMIGGTLIIKELADIPNFHAQRSSTIGTIDIIFK
jgi:hypothetical protein